MSRKNRLWMRWCGVYMGQLVVIYVWLYILLVVGKFVCENMKRVWYRDDITYVFLKWVEEKQIGIILFVMMVSAIILTFYRFHRLEKEMIEIYNTLNNIYEEKDESISLAIELGEIENRLNELKIKNKTDKQAAKEANQRKNELIMYMAHDLKTPLTSVIGYLTLVCEEKDIPQDVKERYMHTALRKAHRSEELTNEFLILQDLIFRK